MPTPNESYLYDPLYRLQQVDDASGLPWQTYTYDKTGDRLSKATAGQSPPDSYSYQSGTHRLTGISGYDTSNRAVDANGNTTAFQANGWTYGLGFNDANRLTMVQQNDATSATYHINGIGERVLKRLQGGGVQLYAYDEAGKLLYSAPGPRRDYIWAGNTLIATIDGPQATINYVQTDQLGTPRAATTTNGTLVWDWPYTQNPFGEAPASGNGYTLNLRFPGQYYDQETGLNYNYFRDYEPSTGRYIESDRIGLKGGLSTYAYTASNPFVNTDFYGMCSITRIPITPWMPYGSPQLLAHGDWHLVAAHSQGQDKDAFITMFEKPLECYFQRSLYYRGTFRKMYLNIKICKDYCHPVPIISTFIDSTYKTENYTEIQNGYTGRDIPVYEDEEEACKDGPSPPPDP